MDDNENDDDDGWKILKPGVVLFETTMGDLDKPIPHPVLDNPSKMMRIIANPVYDKLTISRAANIRKNYSSELIRQPSQLNRSKETTMITPIKSLAVEQTTTTPLPNPAEMNKNRPQTTSSSKRRTSTPFRLPTASSSNQKTSPTARSRATTARSTTQSTQSTLTENSPNAKTSIIDGTIRYVNSRHGFEVQRYSSSNWLSIDLFAKDACQSQEKTFREMLDKKRQYERLSRSIYSSEYYTKRWYELLQKYKQGYLTHAEWAKQNYQILCLRTLYKQARQREQRDVDLDARDARRTRAKSAYHEWKETKNEDISERQNTAQSQHKPEGTSFLSNNSFSIPTLTTADENNTSLADTILQTSISTNGDSDIPRISIYQPIISSKNTSTISNGLYMLDEERWSLQAMLKRVVGLAEPLPPPPKVSSRKQSMMTNTSVDSGFESVH